LNLLDKIFSRSGGLVENVGGIIEGGAFICYKHEYETTSVMKWDKHMSEIPHPTLEVTQKCKKCGQWNTERNLLHPARYVERMHSIKPEDQNVIVLKCPKCDTTNNEV